MDKVNIGMLGAGFIAEFYMQGLQYVRDHDVTAVFSKTMDEARTFAEKWNIPFYTDSVDALVEHSNVDLVVVCAPHFAHVTAVEKIARAGKAVICTKPLGRNAAEAKQCLDAVTQAGVWHGYIESEVFTPVGQRAKQLVESGALGKVYWCRFREAHSQIHWFARDPELNGGGPMRSLGVHGVGFGRWLLEGRQPVEVFAWGDTIARDDVQSEDNALTLIRFEDGALVQVEVSWGHKAGLDLRGEVHGSKGYISTNITNETGMRVFTSEPAGYILEKATIDHGWVNPIPNEMIEYGFHNAMDHFVHTFLKGETPRLTFQDGVIDNAIVDAAYRSMKSRTWEKLILP